MHEGFFSVAQYTKRKMWVLCIFFVCISLPFVGCGTGTETLNKPAGPEHAPDPAKLGPYSVGVKTFRLVDKTRKDIKGNTRPMVIEVWYPAQKPAADAKKDEYYARDDAADKLKNIDKSIEVPRLKQNAYRDAKPLASEGSFPLILYSHGSGGIRYQSIFQTPHLASHGYIVVSADHEDNTLYNILAGANARDQAVLGKSALDRPKDLLFMHKLVTQWNNDEKNEFHKLIQVDNVGVTGHSFGGFTSILATKSIPGLKVIIPQAPLTSLVKLFGVQAKHVAPIPMMMMVGQNDLTLTHAEEAAPFYKEATSGTYHGAERFLINFKKGGHFTFSNICDFNAEQYAARFGFKTPEALTNDGCSPTLNIKPEDGHRLINQYATAYFNLILRKSPDSRKYIKIVDDAQLKVTHNPKP